MGSIFSRVIFSWFIPQQAKGTSAGPNPIEVMQGSQAPDGTSTTINIIVQPSPGLAADGHILHPGGAQEHLSVVSAENSDTAPGLGHSATHHGREPSRIYALIIGIDDYPSLPKLSGAVSDAKAMVEFLRSRMNVPPDRIRLLLNKEASRGEIINAFKQLSEEGEINTEDPILIYYAGHGTQLEAPRYWEAGGPNRKIQAICPWNYQKGDVHVIPDRTIGAYLDLIWKKKGNNITVIFDCCHSASGTRRDAPTSDIRGVPLEDRLPFDLDCSELSALGHKARMTTKFGVRGLGSHILVAACQETETAREDSGRGRFTIALLELFEQEGRMDTLTYTDITSQIKPIQNQHPQVEGIHRDRIIFNAKVARHRPFYAIEFKAGTFTVNAGAIHGVAKGSQFIVYEDEESFLKSSIWGMLLASDVKTSTSILRHCEGSSGIDLVKSGIAVLSAGGANQALLIKDSCDSTHLPSHFREAIHQMENKHIISFVVENAEVGMQLDDGHLRFKILNPNIRNCGLEWVYHKIRPTDTVDVLTRILSAGRTFFWHLTRKQGLRDHPIAEYVKVEFQELYESGINEAGQRIYNSTGENLIRDGSIHLGVSSNPKPYGIKITNNSGLDLYPTAFYFDHSDWSIVEYYEHGMTGNPKPMSPLQEQGGTLAIGYGAGGSDYPISFELRREGQGLDVGHLKIFFMTIPADIRHIRQESPFTSTRTAGRERVTFPDTWFTLQYPIIQRKELG